MTSGWDVVEAAKKFFGRDCRLGVLMARLDAKGAPHALIGVDDPETLTRMVTTLVAIYAMVIRRGGTVKEEDIKRICETVGDVVFKRAYTTSQNLTTEE